MSRFVAHIACYRFINKLYPVVAGTIHTIQNPQTVFELFEREIYNGSNFEHIFVSANCYFN